MTKQQVLEEAIRKTVNRGWKEYGELIEVWQPISTLDNTFMVDMTDGKRQRRFNYEAIIFNHGFAKALWGGPETDVHGTPTSSQALFYTDPKFWQHHLQQMVIAQTQSSTLESI